jgi:cell division septum initiation protein DivIVA
VDLAGQIQQLEDMVKDAKSMPLSSSALLNRDELLELVEQMKTSLPEEVKQARWVVRDREELLAKARRDAEKIVEDARAEQLRMATREEIVQRAKQESERIVGEAGEEARTMRLEAEDYVDAKLAQFENALQRFAEDFVVTQNALTRTLEQVETGRERLRGGVPAQQEFAPQPEPTELHDQEEGQA